jgi:hypothetical protein
MEAAKKFNAVKPSRIILQSRIKPKEKGGY